MVFIPLRSIGFLRGPSTGHRGVASEQGTPFLFILFVFYNFFLKSTKKNPNKMIIITVADSKKNVCSQQEQKPKGKEMLGGLGLDVRRATTR